ncbi:hypothetical protein SK128_008879 [Halocaridina rubra]|uniref:Uncharacterized protein n=1 Tax=Halocaridina rubra TaxID=373956 RepID=A0AAN8WJW5_HALRR
MLDLRLSHGPPRVCKDIFEIGDRRKNMSKMTDLCIRVISKAKKKKKTFLRSLYYEVLAYESPSMVRKTSSGNGISGSNVTIADEWRFQQARGQFSHMPCRLRDYSAREVEHCVAQRRKTSKGRTHLLYIGDSRIRQHVEVMLDHLRDLDLKITTYKGEVLTVEEFLGDKGMSQWQKYKHNFRVESLKASGFIIDFNWAAYVDWGDEPKSLNESLSYRVKRILPKTELNPGISESGYEKNNSQSQFMERGIFSSSSAEGVISKNKISALLDVHTPVDVLPKLQSGNIQSRRKNVMKADSKTSDNSKSSSNNSTRVGAINLLERLNSAPWESLPDIVFINAGVWLLDEDYLTILEHLDFSSVVVSKTLKSLLQRLAERTTVVWLAPDPLKEHVQHFTGRRGIYTHQTNTLLEWLLNAQALLQPPGVLFWDSFLPIAYAADQDCMHLRSQNVDLKHIPRYHMFQQLISWHCLERYHIGFEALSVAVQMALNHICNPYLDNGYCCSEFSKP